GKLSPYLFAPAGIAREARAFGKSLGRGGRPARSGPGGGPAQRLPVPNGDCGRERRRGARAVRAFRNALHLRPDRTAVLLSRRPGAVARRRPPGRGRPLPGPGRAVSRPRPTGRSFQLATTRAIGLVFSTRAFDNRSG